MNDRFKFRIFDKETGKYYKTRISKGSGCIVYQHPASSHYAWIQIGTMFAELERDEKTYANTGLEPDFIIEQCTGLKDKNGNLIYEGDIVKIPDDWETYGFMSGEKREVYFRDGGFRLKPKDTKLGRGHWLKQTSALEIIGNIHEQLEQKDK